MEMAYDRGMTDDIRFGASIQGGARFFHFLHSSSFKGSRVVISLCRIHSDRRCYVVILYRILVVPSFIQF